MKTAPDPIGQKKVVMGFDGFVDTLQNVIRDRADDGTKRYFRQIGEFGDYISGKKGSGFSLETETKLQKAGGNMPITAHALASQGFTVSCIGAMGFPALHPAFAAMHPRCSLHSFENPGITSALEFVDGKMMLCEMAQLNRADWNLVRSRIGLEKIREMLSGADLLCLLNWSELNGSTGFWTGLLSDIFPFIDRPKHIFADLSDCSGRSPEAIGDMLSYLKILGENSPVTLSLNRNETKILAGISGIPVSDDLRDLGESLFPKLNVSELVLHSARISLAVNADETVVIVPDHIEQPLITTGAGDHFNAGYCAAILSAESSRKRLQRANATAAYYMSTGQSPGRKNLPQFS
ncbi:MAG: hypothetical protein INR69_10295 [Mucilaginibacter polytrichastri]|nr:hypothetical protein [Mucilaginibacter polytrichastri]